MKRFTSLNNSLCRRIIMSACQLNYKTCYPLLFNSRTQLDEYMFLMLFSFLLEVCPIHFHQFKELHPEIQSYMNNYYAKLKELKVEPRFN